jgi:hypothetical protein
MGLNRKQQQIVDAFRAEYLKHNPIVQQEIARAVSFAERQFWPVVIGFSIFFLVVGVIAGLGWPR